MYIVYSVIKAVWLNEKADEGWEKKITEGKYKKNNKASFAQTIQ